VNGRTDPECFNSPTVKEAIESMHKDVPQWRKSLENVLTAYVRRNHSPGPLHSPSCSTFPAPVSPVG